MLDEKNAFEMLRGEDEDNFMFVQGCETIDKDIRVISCKKLRQKNRNLTRNCYKLDIVGTPLSYCLQRKVDERTVRNKCVKTYLTSQVSSTDKAYHFITFYRIKMSSETCSIITQSA